MEYKKLTADCDEVILNKVKKASKFERRTVANFIRLACEERATKILEESQCN